MTIDCGLSDIVADRFDAGVRLGASVARDMIGVRISPDIPMDVIGSPDCLANKVTPRLPEDLLAHSCINLHQPTAGTNFAWPLLGGGGNDITSVSVKGALTLNAIDLIRDASLDGHGLAHLPLHTVEAAIAAGRLTRLLPGRVPDLPGYHLYCASRRHSSPAFKMLVDALRWRG